MFKKCNISGLLAGAAFLLMPSLASAAEKYLVIPVTATTSTPTCTAPDEVVSARKCWKDRNLGATQVATNPADAAAYGDLYQWGRLGDGHQNRTSDEISANSANDVPGHSDFIKEGLGNRDWRIPQNHNLWQGLGGINNPCPQGFRIPTKAEWDAEIASWNSTNAKGAYSSPLKLVLAGYRNNSGNIYDGGVAGSYMASTVDGVLRGALQFNTTTAYTGNGYRAYGLSVRCIKN